MPFAIRHRDDFMPDLEPLEGLRTRIEFRPEAMGKLQHRDASEMSRRFAEGHRAYIAYINDEPAAWGWVGGESARIGEVNAIVQLPPNERYLWNFVTLERYRGRGIYPRLLQAIVREESRSADRFWIAYAPENRASGVGIAKAGFTTLAELSFDRHGHAALKSMVDGGATNVSRVLPLEEASGPLTPCWRCVRAGRPPMSCADGACACDYQRPEVACA
jgi:GNAT superfamily N-acetyltransferase